MKVFISADIEGTAFTTYWEETDKDKRTYEAAAKEMTAEVVATCEGAIAAGADHILINDAHDFGINIDPFALPDCAELIRGWSGSPLSMADGIDESFDAAMFVGWHASAGRPGNPLSHTMSTKTTRVWLNGKRCSEFMLYSYACANFGVPSVLLAGDATLIRDSEGLHPTCKTVAVKDGRGGMTRCLAPVKAQRLIREAAEAALRQDLSHACAALPKSFDFTVQYKEHKNAVKFSYYPGFQPTEDDTTITLHTDKFMDVLTAAYFVL